MQAKFERGHDSEVAATPSQAPEELGVLLRARYDVDAIRRDHVAGQEIIDRQSKLAHQMTNPAPKREARDAGVTDDTSRRGEPECLAFTI